jgi:hypothetical protein
MSHAFFSRAFTSTVRAFQERNGSRMVYRRAELDETEDTRLGPEEAEFIAARDGFYQASVGETGWPYVQFRGGPTGFLKVLDDRTLGYADFRGNRQYVSAGNLTANDRVALFLMDYAARRRLKLLGRARLIDQDADPALVERLAMPRYRARVERAVIVTVEAFDWNCPQHITPRFTREELRQSDSAAQEEIANLKATLAEATRRLVQKAEANYSQGRTESA